MWKHRTSVICTSLLLLTSCAANPAPTKTGTPIVSTIPATRVEASATPTNAIPTPTSTIAAAPTHFTNRIIVSHSGRPDDLVFDQKGNLLFSDVHNGTINRVNKDGSVTVLLSGLAGPEGMVVLPNGTLIFSEQQTNSILILTAGAHTPTLLRVLPGTPSSASCKDGVDGIGFDAQTQTIIVPDSPTGNVYGLSLDGKTLTLLIGGMVRPVGAAVDTQGNIYVADECGGSVWRLSTGGQITHINGFRMPDDVAFDPQGDLLVIDLAIPIHALIRVNLLTGKRETLASQGFIEPQGLLVTGNGTIYVSDDYANTIVEYQPA